MCWARMLAKSPRERGCCTGPAQVEYIILRPRIKALGKLQSFLDYVYLLCCERGGYFCTDLFCLVWKEERLVTAVRTLFCYYMENKLFTFSGIIAFSSEDLAFYRESGQQGRHAALQFATINKIKGRGASEPLDRQLFALGGQTNCENKV